MRDEINYSAQVSSKNMQWLKQEQNFSQADGSKQL